MKMRIAFYTLGCKVNQYETQALKEAFAGLGWEVVEDHEPAEVYVVNTCTVTGLSDRKSRQYIRRMKRENPDCVTCVIGCYAQVSPEEAAAIEGVDVVAGTNEKSRLPELVEEFLRDRKQVRRIKDYEELKEYEETGVITSMESRTRAFLKIQEGCNQFCSYCIIPYARGAVRSRALTDIVSEAESLINQGFKELVLTGINTALYGREPGFHVEGPETEEGVHGIEIAVRALNRLPGDFRIRLGSLEPTVVSASYVERLMKYEKLCPHLHLSLQSGSDRILAAMNRHYNRRDYLDIVEVLRRYDPGYGITADVIVGFPGETEEDFTDSVELVRAAKLCRTHVFPYSKRKGTPAAELPGQLTTQEKKARGRRLTEAAEETAVEFCREICGQVRTVLFEEWDQEAEAYRGYADNYVRVYTKDTEMEESELLNRFWEVELTEPFRDGVLGRLTF